MNSMGKMILTVLVTTLVIGGGTYYFVNNKAITDKTALQTQVSTLTTEKATKDKATEDLQSQIADLKKSTAATANIVKYSLANYSTPKTNLNLQFELPDGYGAAMDQEGEGALVVTYNVGKFVSQNGKNVIQVTTSVPTHVKIIPSFDSKVTTLADWQKKDTGFDLLPSDAKKMTDVTIAGITATRYDVGGFGEYHLIQFVKDKSFYEIRNEVGLDEDVISKIIATFTFTK